MIKDFKEIIKQLEKPDLNDKINAVRELVKSGDKRAVKHLIKILKDSLGDYQKRLFTCEIINALGNFGSEEAVSILLEAVSSTYYFEQEVALDAINKISPETLNVKKLENIAKNKQEPQVVRKKAVKSLGKSGNGESVEALKEIAEEVVDINIKEQTIKSLGETKKEEAVDPLLKLYYGEASDKIKTEVIKALANIATLSSVVFLVEALSYDNPDIRSCAALALGETGNVNAKPHLQKLLDDSEDQVRKSAAKALGIIEFLPR
jgi:HEAT repeat protein